VPSFTKQFRLDARFFLSPVYAGSIPVPKKQKNASGFLDLLAKRDRSEIDRPFCVGGPNAIGGCATCFLAFEEEV
jgi:hypothetical protein